MAELTPMMKQYMETKSQYQDCILFYRLGDFYEMFFEDALTASRELEITLTGKNCGQEEKAPMCGVPYHAVEGYLNRLVAKGYKVAICEQVEDPKTTKGIVKREVVRIVTPGTNLDTQALDETKNNYIMCIVYIADRYGVSVADISTGDYFVTEIPDSAKLLDEIYRFSPSEIICNEAFYMSGVDMDGMKDRLGITIYSLESWYFDDEVCRKKLLEHFEVSSFAGLGLADYDCGIISAGALLQYLLIHLALSHPEVSFLFINNGQEKLRTSGNGKLKDVIYNVYGREVTSNLLELDYKKDGLSISGFLGKPVITRGNRNFENFFVNGRYVKSAMLSKSLEDAYKDFTMQHKFPFAVLHFQVEGDLIDVNVHPTKMELRFQRQQEVYNTMYEAVHRRLLEPELIQTATVPDPADAAQKKKESPFLLKPKSIENTKYDPIEKIREKMQEREPEQVREKAQETKPEQVREKVQDEEQGQARKQTSAIEADKESVLQSEPQIHDEDYFIRKMRERVKAYHERSSSAEVLDRGEIYRPQQQAERIREAAAYRAKEADKTPKQMDLFEENFLKREVKAEYTLIGQVFDTYWLVQFQDSLYIIDQHAAHERVMYERTLKEMKSREYTSQYLSPPIILSLSMQEAQLLEEHIDRFTRIGFEIEHFGGEEYAVRAVPDNLFGIAKKELLMEMIDDLADGINTSMTPDLIDEKVASMSCKAAVKGNNRLSAKEVDALIGELLTLDNPYHCPHGRPTIIAMTKRELEKKFKRIV